MSMQLWGEVNKPCQTCRSDEQGGNVTKTSAIVGKCREECVFMAASCSTWFGPLSPSFFHQRDAKDMALPRTSPADQQSQGPRTAPARDSSAGKPN